MMSETDLARSYDLAQALVAWGEAVQGQVRSKDQSVLDALCVGHEVSAARRESLSIALALGADDETLRKIRDALHVARRDTIVLPQGEYEHCSRGRGWARQGQGDSVQWGAREANGYRVGPGRWVVGSTDGFRRKFAMDWDVAHIVVGDQTWTVAS